MESRDANQMADEFNLTPSAEKAFVGDSIVAANQNVDESVEMDMEESNDGHTDDDNQQLEEGQAASDRLLPRTSESSSLECDQEKSVPRKRGLASHDLPRKYHVDINYDYDDDNSDLENVKISEKLSNIIQVLNVSPLATLDQLENLFKNLGNIKNIVLYEHQDLDALVIEPSPNFKVCFVEFDNSNSVLMAQHLTNTVFIDRALTVLPYKLSPNIPDKQTALKQTLDSEHLNKFSTDYAHQLSFAVSGVQFLVTNDPRLVALGLPQYPQLPINTEPSRIEEIRRTVYIGNLDSTIPPDQVLKFFNDIGEVKYIRMAGDDTQPTRFAFVEFTHQASVANALQHNGFVLGSRGLKINHSNNAIVKPQPKIEILNQDDVLKRGSTSSRGYNSSRTDHDDRRSRHRSSSKYDRGRDRSDRRATSPRRRSPVRRRSRSRDRDSVSRRRRSRSRDDRMRSSKRSRSRDKAGDRSSARDRSKESRRSKRSRSKSSERSSRHNHRHKSSRR